MTCCGKEICSGCVYAPLYDNQGNKVDNQKCPFCRTPFSASDEEQIDRLKKRAGMNDAIAINNLGDNHRDGRYGFTQDHLKALESYHRAGELGYSLAYTNIGALYFNGEGVEVDKMKATHYFELEAMMGNVAARFILGANGLEVGNMERALKHYMNAVRGGYFRALEKI